MTTTPLPDDAGIALENRPEDVVLSEHDSHLMERELSEEAYVYIDELGSSRLSVSYDRTGAPTLHSSHHVGIVSLPNGPTVEIRPKAAGANLLYLFKYAHDLKATTYERSTGFEPGETFLDVLGALYLAELDETFRRGLQRMYRRFESDEKHLRGQLNVQRQIRRQGVAPTRFECSYEELSHETTANQAILYATTVLGRLVSDTRLRDALRGRQTQLRRRVTLRHVRVAELDEIKLNRLTDYYADILRLTRLVLVSVYLENLRAGERESFTLLVDMNRVFERVVERALEAAITDRTGWRVDVQATVDDLLTGGSPRISMRPDTVVRDEKGEVVLVADAKWKTPSSPANSDVYQLVAYQTTYSTPDDPIPGALVYPSQDGDLETAYSVKNAGTLAVVELPTRRPFETFEAFRRQLESSTSAKLDAFLSS